MAVYAARTRPTGLTRIEVEAHAPVNLVRRIGEHAIAAPQIEERNWERRLAEKDRLLGPWQCPGHRCDLEKLPEDEGAAVHGTQDIPRPWWARSSAVRRRVGRSPLVPAR